MSDKISDALFQSQTLSLTSPEWLIRLKWNQNGGASAGCLWTIWHWLWPHPWPLIFQGQKFKITIRNWLMWNKKESISLRYSADCMVLHFDHTHDLDIIVSRSKFEIALFQEWEGWLRLNERDVWVDHSWPWLWPTGNHGGVGGCTA